MLRLSKQPETEKLNCNRLKGAINFIHNFDYRCYCFNVDKDDRPLKYQINIPRLVTNNAPKITICGMTYIN